MTPSSIRLLLVLSDSWLVQRTFCSNHSAVVFHFSIMQIDAGYFLVILELSSVYSVFRLTSILQCYQFKLTSEELCILLVFFLMFWGKTLFVTFVFSLISRVYRYIISDDVYWLFKMNLGYSIYRVLEYEWASLCPNIIEGLAMTISCKKSRLSSSYFQIVSWLRLSCRLIPSTFVLVYVVHRL